jgi:hypothetical protein
MALTDQQFAFFLRSMADQLLMYPAAVTGIPAPLVGTFVEGATVGSVNAGKAKGRKGKVSAYNKAFAKAFTRRRDMMTKKNGDWKKNCNSAKCMSKAHQDTRKIMKSAVAGGRQR